MSDAIENIAKVADNEGWVYAPYWNISRSLFQATLRKNDEILKGYGATMEEANKALWHNYRAIKGERMTKGIADGLKTQAELDEEVAELRDEEIAALTLERDTLKAQVEAVNKVYRFKWKNMRAFYVGMTIKNQWEAKMEEAADGISQKFATATGKTPIAAITALTDKGYQ